MKNISFSKRLKKSFLNQTSVKDKTYQQHCQKNLNSSTSGFTLIEVLAVIVIVGILSAIAAPSWLSFVARQRLNKGNDSILAALQEAQRKAKNSKFSYNISFRTLNNEPQIAIYPIGENAKSYWRNLGRDSGVNTDKFLLGTNLQASNTKKTGNINYGAKFNDNSQKDPPQTITFNHIGILESTNNNPADTGLKIVLAIPKTQTPTQPSDAKRCVIVETLIGGIKTAKDDDCD